MIPTIDKERTGRRLRLILNYRGISVLDIKEALSLGCVQSVYHWLNGKSLPTLDNLYALSELFDVSMDTLICGNKCSDHSENFISMTDRMICYIEMTQKYLAA